MAWFELFRSGRKLGEVQLTGREAIVGRSKGADLHVDDPRVSRRHAKVFAEGGAWVVEDLETPNGTFVNGVREYHRRLDDGDRLELGACQLVFHLAPGESAPADAPPRPRFEKGGARRALEAQLFDDDEETDPGLAPPARKPRSSAAPVLAPAAPDATRVADPKELARARSQAKAALGPHLVGADREIHGLDRPKTIIGSGSAAHVKPAGLERARAACLERREDGSYVLRKLGLLGKVAVNGRRTRGTVLRDGDVVLLGETKLVFRTGRRG